MYVIGEIDGARLDDLRRLDIKTMSWSKAECEGTCHFGATEVFISPRYRREYIHFWVGGFCTQRKTLRPCLLIVNVNLPARLLT